MKQQEKVSFSAEFVSPMLYEVFLNADSLDRETCIVLARSLTYKIAHCNSRQLNAINAFVKIKRHTSMT